MGEHADRINEDGEIEGLLHGPNGAPLECPEPNCGGELVLKPSRYGQFYGCENWRETRCPGAHGAHPDGTPLGIPATKETRAARRRAHVAFDPLWKEHGLFRGQAYKWLSELMGKDAHIGAMTIEECEKVATAAYAYGLELLDHEE